MKKIAFLLCNTSFVLLSVLFLSITVFSCGKEDKYHQDYDTEDFRILGDTIEVVENSKIQKQLGFQEVFPQEFRAELTTAGIVKAIPNKYARITPPFAGKVLKSYVRLGQMVSAGSPLFAMSSPDYFAAQKEYFDAVQELKQAERNYKRQQDLVEHGVGIKKELEEAETVYRMNQSAVSNSESILKVFNMNFPKISLDQKLIVRSPIAGQVIENFIVIGQYVKKDEDDPLVIVAEVSKVWVVGQIKEKDLALARGLENVDINIASYPGKNIKGKIFHVGESVDENTRSVEVLIECDNREEFLKLGMYATVHFKRESEMKIIIPSEAVFQGENEQFVFLKVGRDKFMRKSIHTEGTSKGGNIVVASGLEQGDTIVSKGGIYLLDIK
ncbi:MAG: efflux RND transporter periplasmic adaptor subunit [Bergeyella sp.]|nr:efflux RND transporter periplasmic adaptor subunit [Bergeyella sp.]